MNEEQRNVLFDLLTKRALYGLDETEQDLLKQFDSALVENEFRSIELTTAALSMVGMTADEPLPAELHSKILASADKYVDEQAATEPLRPGPELETTAEPAGWSIFGLLGWAAAAAACIALAVNIYMTRLQPAEVVQVPTAPVETPRALTPAEQRDELLRSGATLVKADWAPGNVKEIKEVSGDIVWSDEKQLGFVRLRGLPVRTAPLHCYQLWIFDKTQDKSTPIDGGIFDVNAEGEIVIPINAKLPAEKPYQFALTIERHGGVVVSDRERIAALAKVETPSV